MLKRKKAAVGKALEVEELLALSLPVAAGKATIVSVSVPHRGLTRVRIQRTIQIQRDTGEGRASPA